MRRRKAIGGRQLCATATDGMELGVLDPQVHANYGSQLLIRCINYTTNHNCHALAISFDASGKGAYVRWEAMVDVVGRWMCVGVRGGKMIDTNNGGQMGHPSLFPRHVHCKSMALLLPKYELIVLY